jgi:threonine/homoserine/homoserine lactone efflux protein
MGEVIGDLLPLALGVAISPVPIIAVILMLFAPRAGSTSMGFMIGWVVGIVLAVVAVLLLAGLIGDGSDDGPPAAVSWIKIVLGVLFILLAAMQWRSRPKPGTEPELPGWMSAIDSFTPGKATGLGFLLSAINPKNLAMAIAAGVAIGGAGLSGGQQTVAVIVYVVIAACTVVVPVVGYAVAADRLREPLDDLKSWLEANNATVMAVLLLVLGFVVFGKGLGELI